MTIVAKTEKINMRLSSEALIQLREAASLNQQDLTSFVLGAALAQARQVMIESRSIQLSPSEWHALDQLLADDSHPDAAGAERFRRASAKWDATKPAVGA